MSEAGAWIVLGLLAALNLAGYALMAYDKNAARLKHRRIAEKHLWLLSLCGAALGSSLAMVILRHKTKHQNFVFGLPLLACIQVTLIWLFFMKG